MIAIRRAEDRGHFNHGWLDTYHTFSFGDYQDSKHHQFRALRVMNEDRVAPGKGFGTHPHRDMEIGVEGAQVHHKLIDGRHAWLQVLRGSVILNDHDLNAVDGSAVSNENVLVIHGTSDAEIMLFDLA